MRAFFPTKKTPNANEAVQNRC